MGPIDDTAPRRRGRPPATDSTDTWNGLLHSARRLFGERGYDAVTNRELAAAAGITTSALYHYVESKLDLYVRVNDQMQERIYERFQRAVESSPTFLGKLEAVLEAAHEMNAEDPSLARFVGAVQSDLRRNEEVRRRMAVSVAERERFFTNLVEVGIATGEIDERDRAAMAGFIRTILVGLTHGTSESATQQRRAIDGITGVLRGSLLRPPRPADRAS